jgi:hypothetical protein
MILSKLKDGRRAIIANKSYFLYAIGEISLIVIGILVALQVDNWREDISNQNKVESYSNLIESDLSDQLAEIDAQVKSELEILRESENLVKSYNLNKGFVTDAQYSASIGNINNWRTFIKINPAFEQLLTTGDVGLISNQKLKQSIFSYYHQLRKVEAIITENHEYIKTSFSPLVLRLSNHSLPNFQNKLYSDIVKLGYVPTNIDDVLSNSSESDAFIQKNIKREDLKLELYNSIKFRYRISAVHLS